ncbi:MAG: response regulator [Synechococcales bacterium]|nr:response regulator [Synechococcales bacterium]
MQPSPSDFILIVDDTPANLAVLAQTLKGAGYAVRVAMDGESALQQAEDEQPSLILLDVMMPGIDGFETCRQLKANPKTHSVPVIFMTALGDSENRIQGLSLGAVDYITKPFNEPEVLARIRIHLSLQNLLQTLQSQNERLKAEITQRQLAEQALQRANAELAKAQIDLIQQEKLSALGDLVAGVAHEISNPISCISGSIQLVQNYSQHLLQHLALYQSQYPEGSDRIAAHAEKVDLDYLVTDFPSLMKAIQMSSDRIFAMSRSLRIFARYDVQHRKVKADLQEILDSTLLILNHRLKAQEHRDEITVIREYGGLPDVFCFPDRLSQVFMNILANAIDAFDERCSTFAEDSPRLDPSDCSTLKTSPLQLRIAADLEDMFVVFRIEDNAGGMPESVKERIFERAFTTKPVGKGTGLGLSIVRQIVVDDHGGGLTCQSILGVGTEFTIKLPMHSS